MSDEGGAEEAVEAQAAVEYEEEWKDPDDEQSWHADHGKRVDGPFKFELIESNVFVHRKEKTVREEDIMECSCGTQLGCADEHCENRYVYLECVPGFCKAGKRCQNQRFLHKKYAKVEVFQTKMKGFGLRTLEALKPGDLVMEYVGELLDYSRFKRRTKDYAEEGVTHFYFMSLTNDELIDATKKGNFSRFINHSCAPNCETQKWTVLGEPRIGLFATDPVDAGEELTFDYQFQRYGEKAQRCYCGTKACSGMIGGAQKTELRAAVKEYESGSEDGDFSPGGEQRRRKRRLKLNSAQLTIKEQVELMQRADGSLRRSFLKDFGRLMFQEDSTPGREALAQTLIRTRHDVGILKEIVEMNFLRQMYSWLREADDNIFKEQLVKKVLELLDILPVTLTALRAAHGGKGGDDLRYRVQQLTSSRSDEIKQRAEGLLGKWDRQAEAQEKGIRITRLDITPEKFSRTATATPESVKPIALPRRRTAVRSDQGRDFTRFDGTANAAGAGASDVYPHAPAELSNGAFSNGFGGGGNDFGYMGFDSLSRAASGASTDVGGFAPSTPRADDVEMEIDPPEDSSAPAPPAGPGPVPVPELINGFSASELTSGAYRTASSAAAGAVLPTGGFNVPGVSGQLGRELTAFDLEAQRLMALEERKVKEVLDRGLGAQKRKRDEESGLPASKKARTANGASGGDRDKWDPSSHEFRERVSQRVINVLTNKFKERVPEKEDFKHLARKLCHLIIEKENNLASKHPGGGEYVVTGEQLKKRSFMFIKEFFAKLPSGPYQRKKD